MIDIGSEQPYPAKELSNFNPYAFEVDGVPCASMEGFLQSLKFEDEQKQREMCLLWGGNAKKKGSKKNKRWKTAQTLHWKGQAMHRESQMYQELLDRAFNALATNEAFMQALLATGDEPLTHSYGRTEKKDTVLTIDEFCTRLDKIRKK